MSFLNSPLLLYGWPLIFLPIVIHLINRQRHRTVPWGAMMFLLDAKRLQRSMAKLRYWLIMAMRMLGMAGGWPVSAAMRLFYMATPPLSSPKPWPPCKRPGASTITLRPPASSVASTIARKFSTASSTSSNTKPR